MQEQALMHDDTGGRDADMRTLLAIEQIKQLKARYFLSVDSKDWDEFRNVFAPDGTLSLVTPENPDGETTFAGQEAIVAFVRKNIEDVLSVHHGHMPIITVHDEASASGIWAMEDMLRWPAGSPINAMHGYGHYYESYRRIDGEWRIAATRLTRLRVDIS